MKTRVFLVSVSLALSFQPIGAAPLPAGYGVGRANDPADHPAQVSYGAIVAPRAPGSQAGLAESAPQRINATFTVTTPADNVPGSLRTAITSANASPGLDLITFAIGSGSVSLTPGSQLPDIVDPVVIDGTTQPGFAGVPIVELAGTSAGPNAIGLVIKAGNSTVRGLIINRWLTTGSGGFGIVLDVLGNNAIEGCWIGLGADGTTAQPNAVNGIAIFNGSINNRIGGTTATQRNVLSGNTSSGIQIGTGNGGFNTIQGNWIGLNGLGTAVLANGGNGIFLNASDNTIGGTVPGARNVISGNALPGIFIGFACQRTLVVGNYIGTDPSGTLDWGNQQNGVNLDQASNNKIGDGTFAGRNVISGNEFPGVYLFGPGTGNSVQGNFICTTAAGNVGLGDGTGIVLNNVTNSMIGGTTLAARNLVSGSPSFTGIAVINGASQNTITGNYVGTDSTGTAALPMLKGILINNSPNNTIGNTLGAGNVVSGNVQYGVEIRGAAATGNMIYGNRIGTNPSGTGAVGNLLDGIVLNSSSAEVKFDNVIAFNGRAGVFDSTGSKYVIEGNSIFQNGQFGIDNFPRGLTINDILDADTGANDLQNFPILDSVRVTPSELRILGKLNSRPNRSYRLVFYDNQTCGTAHFGEGRSLRASADVTTDATGKVQFAVITPAAFAPPNYITATATDILDGSTSEFSQCLCLMDSDADGIMDCWETENWGIDINSDGVRDLDLYARGARSNHKDVFVEIDAMNGHVPPVFSIQMVIDAFARAPQDEVQNPDGLDGINLHALLDETDIPQQPLANTFVDLDQLKLTTFGTQAEKNNLNSPSILAAKRLVYRYCMFARTFTSSTGDTTSLGIAEYDFFSATDDFVVGLGSTGPCGNSELIGDIQVNAGTFMHELGHTLGLDHGGALEADNFKPNYYSIMNYTWAIPRKWAAPNAWRLDYAHKPGLDPQFIHLNETGLRESAGLVSGPGPIITVPYTDSMYTVRQARAEYGFGVDWNGDGLYTRVVPVDINEPGHGTLDCQGITNTKSSVGQTLYAASDWDVLKYNFRSTPRFHHPDAVVSNGDYAAIGMLTGPESLPEPDGAQERVLDNLPAPRPTGKFVMNGVLDAAAAPLATNGGITLYGVYQPPQLYLATNAAAAQGGDMVVLLSDARGALRAAPLGKAGQAGAWNASLFGRATGDPSAWADGTEAPLTSVTVDTSAAVLEGVVDVGLLFGRNPPNLYLALAKYAQGPGGALLAQAPAGNGDGNVDGAEFLSLSGLVSVPETPSLIPPGVHIALLGAQPTRGGARFRLTLESAADVDVSLQDVAGRRVARIARGAYEAGPHDLAVGEGMAPGVYFLVVRALGETRAMRVVIVH